METKPSAKSAVINILLLAIMITENSFTQTFTRIDTGIVCANGRFSYAGSFGDFNNDGLDDLIIVEATTTTDENKLMLFANEGNWNFRQIKEGAIAEYSESYGSTGASWVDFDNDGDLDLFVAMMYNNKNLLFLNKGDGSFTQVTEGSIVNDLSDPSLVTLTDIENDGYIDLYVFNLNAKKNFLYHNNNEGTYTRFTGGEYVNHVFNEDVGTGSIDIDNDGDGDLFGSAINDRNYLYINDGNGNFTAVDSGDIVDNGSITFTCAWGDYDNDGYLDVFIPTWGTDWVGEYDILCHNNGDGTFTKITGIAPVNEKTGTDMGCWADFDNDGYLDLFTSTNWETKNFLYRNNGNNTFTKLDVEAFTDDMGGWASISDIDKDGFLDILIPRGHHSTPPFKNTIYVNDGNTNSWLTINLSGTVSNRKAIGARVKAKATIHDTPVWQVREIGVSGLAGHTHAHFGFGDALVIDSLVIQWPAGHDTILENVAINQILNITEEIPTKYLRASYTVDTTMGRGELIVQFRDLSRTDPAHPVTSWTWDFNGDGIKDSNLQNPVHTFTNPLGEIFDVSLVISNGTHTDTITRKDFIQLYPSLAENLAQWAMATTSSNEHPILIAQNAIDGEMLSRWSSNATDTEWLKVEMDSIYTIGKVIVQWEAAYGSGYMVSVSEDDSNWDTIYCENSGNGSEDIILFNGIKAKYVKLTGFDRGTPYGYSIYEFEIYRSDGNVYPKTECSHTGLESSLCTDSEVKIYPNPFNESVHFSFMMQKSDNVQIKVIDLTGKKIATVYSSQAGPGQQVIQWDGKDNRGLSVCPGFYFYYLKIGDTFKSEGKLLITE